MSGQRWIGIGALLLIGFGLLAIPRSRPGASLVGMSASSTPIADPLTAAPTDQAPGPAALDAPPLPPVAAPVTANSEPSPPDIAPLPSGWREEVSTTERPTIEVKNQTGDTDPSMVLFTGSTGTYSLNCIAPIAAIQVPPDDYAFELRSTHYNNTGEADMTGRFRCRRFRKYSVRLVITESTAPLQRDFGDPR